MCLINIAIGTLSELGPARWAVWGEEVDRTGRTAHQEEWEGREGGRAAPFIDSRTCSKVSPRGVRVVLPPPGHLQQRRNPMPAYYLLYTTDINVTVVCPRPPHTQVISNNAAAALMFPVAIRMGAELAIETKLVSVAVMLGASSAFITPFGYQVSCGWVRHVGWW